VLLTVELLILGSVVASNNLAVAMALGALGQGRRRWRVVGVFGGFEFFMPLIGLLVGREVAAMIDSHVAWLAPMMLLVLGTATIATAVRDHGDDLKLARRITTWWGLILLAAALSVDNVIVGFSLGLLHAPPLLVAGTIGVFSVAFTWLGIHLGNASRRHWERWARLAAGAMLLVLATLVALV
jgi:manganese efflux pump family protein